MPWHTSPLAAGGGVGPASAALTLPFLNASSASQPKRPAIEPYAKIMVFFFALATVGRSVAADLDETEPPYDQVAARIAGLTTGDERIFVWGNSPQLYVLARRPMGTRFSFCNYLTGESPGTPTETGRWDADSNQNPSTWQMLFADLERRRPALLVDAAAAGWNGYDKYPLARYPRLAAYVAEHYRPVEVRAGVVLYRRVAERP